MIGRGRVFLAAQTPQCAVVAKARPAAMTPDEALPALKDGHERFVAGASVNGDPRAQVRDPSTSTGPITFLS